MNYGQLRDSVLKLLNQYSVAGTIVPDYYNNQADYIRRIPAMANDAIMEIATTVRRIPVLIRLDELESEDLGEQTRFTMPEDFYQFQSGSVVKTVKGRLLHSNRYMIQGRTYLLIPNRELDKHDFEVIYYRYPHLLPDYPLPGAEGAGEEGPADDLELDNVPETHPAVALYVASQLAGYEDAYLSTKLTNQYANRLELMGPDITAETHATNDVYHFFDQFIF